MITGIFIPNEYQQASKVSSADSNPCDEVELSEEAECMLNRQLLTIKNDLIENPSHYTLVRAASDCFSVMQQIGLLNDHEIATAFQYLWRCNLKNQKISDLKKARWFLDKAIERYESSNESK